MAGEPDESRWDKGYATGRREGFHRGREYTRQEVLEYLNDRYLEEGRVDPNSPGAKAVLRIAHEVAALLNPSQKRKPE